MSNELRIAGMGVSKSVVSTIVGAAAEKVEGVASVYGKDIASGIIAMLTSKPQPTASAVECSVVDGDAIAITGAMQNTYTAGAYTCNGPEEVRAAVAEAVDAQIGVRVANIDVCIDELVFPKE